MFRYLSAIGMSDYINKKALNSYIHRCLFSPEVKTDIYTDAYTGETSIELCDEMDTFGVILKGVQQDSSLSITAVLPIVRTFRNHMRFSSWNTEGLNGNYPILYGDDLQFGTPLEVILTQRHDFLRHSVQNHSSIRVGVCGLSVSGQILLNILRTSEDEEAYREEENWRRDIARRALSGDADAEHILDEDSRLMEQDVLERLQNEDVYTILEGLMIPADDSTLGYYNVLGTIINIHKILNPFTEEWVYEFELNVMGTPHNIYINPRDLEGTPSVGMRSQGTAMLLGKVIWDEE